MYYSISKNMFFPYIVSEFLLQRIQQVLIREITEAMVQIDAAQAFLNIMKSYTQTAPS